jgi:hypothetical protein
MVETESLLARLTEEWQKIELVAVVVFAVLANQRGVSIFGV